MTGALAVEWCENFAMATALRPASRQAAVSTAVPPPTSSTKGRGRRRARLPCCTTERPVCTEAPRDVAREGPSQ